MFRPRFVNDSMDSMHSMNTATVICVAVEQLCPSQPSPWALVGACLLAGHLSGRLWTARQAFLEAVREPRDARSDARDAQDHDDDADDDDAAPGQERLALVEPMVEPKTESQPESQPEVKETKDPKEAKREPPEPPRARRTPPPPPRASAAPPPPPPPPRPPRVELPPEPPFVRGSRSVQSCYAVVDEDGRVTLRGPGPASSSSGSLKRLEPPSRFSSSSSESS